LSDSKNPSVTVCVSSAMRSASDTAVASRSVSSSLGLGWCSRPVSYGLLDWTSWTYDTELACRAVVADRTEQRFAELQRRFYVDNDDLTRPDAFDLDVTTPELADATRADFAEARELGAVGFPTLLLEHDGERIVVAAGYQPAGRVLRTTEVLTG
jgi:protein-disulfide isomerase-like protein with CxxC motif